jgi:hypothetical protein
MGWLFSEDSALKKKLQGLTVYDANAPQGRPVPVRFRLPETEVADLTFPIIIIEHDGWYPAPEREHRGFVQLPYAPEGYAPWWKDTGPATTVFDPADSPYWSFIPIPYNLDYYITFYTRIMHEHTIPLVQQLAQHDRLHPKFAYLDVPQDGTIRTMQILGGPALIDGFDENNKRYFSVKYKVRVFSELLSEILTYGPVTQINLDINLYSNIQDLTTEEVSQAIGLYSVGANTSWETNTLN